jgi:hypothetical protein
MILHVIAVAYERPIELRGLIDCFIRQTDPRWKLYIMYDGPAPKSICEVMGLYDDKRIEFYASAKRNGLYGHPNRKKMLDALEGDDMDYILLTNDDNWYVPVFVETMLGKCSRTIGIVYCDTVHSHFKYTVHESQLKRSYIDMGAFIVKYPVAKAIGFNHVDFDADGIYAEECRALSIANKYDLIHVNKPLFVHN